MFGVRGKEEAARDCRPPEKDVHRLNNGGRRSVGAGEEKRQVVLKKPSSGQHRRTARATANGAEMEWTPFSAPAVWIAFLGALGAAVLLLLGGAATPGRNHHPGGAGTSARLRINLGVIHLIQGYSHEALGCFQAVEDGPLLPVSIALSGIAQDRLGKNDRAQALYDTANQQAGACLVPSRLAYPDKAKNGLKEADGSLLDAGYSAEGLFLLGVWLACTDRIQPGLDALEKCEDQGFDELTAHTARAAAMLAGHDIEACIELASAAIENGAGTPALLVLAAAKIEDHCFGEALSSLDRIRFRGPVRVPALHLKARAYMSLDMDDESETAWYRVLAMNDDYSPAFLWLCALYTKQDRLSSAKENLDRALMRGEKPCEWAMIEGDFYMKSGESSKAASIWKRALALDPDLHEAERKLGFYHLGIEEYDKALAMLNKVMREQGEDFDLLHGIFEAASAQEKHGTVLFALDRMDRLKPFDPQVQVDYVKELERFKKHGDAARYLERVLAEDRMSPACLLYYLAKTVSAPPQKDAEDFLPLIIWKILRHNHSTAADLLKAMDELLLADKHGFGERWNYRMLSSLAGKAVILTGGNDINAMERLSDVLERMNQPEEAARILEMIARKCPKNSEIRELRKRLNAKRR